MFGWLAVVNVPLMVLAVILPVTVNALNPLRLVIVALVALTVPACTVPDTDKLVNWPSAVMFGWLAVVNVPLMVLAVILPVTVNALKLPSDVIVFKVP